MKYIYTLIMTLVFLVGYLYIDYQNPTFRTIYVTFVVAFMSFTNYMHYEQTKLNNNETKK